MRILFAVIALAFALALPNFAAAGEHAPAPAKHHEVKAEKKAEKPAKKKHKAKKAHKAEAAKQAAPEATYVPAGHDE